MKGDFPLGIQSYCFREFKTIRSLIDGLKKVNLPYVEIYPGHIDYRQGPKKTDADLAAKAMGFKQTEQAFGPTSEKIRKNALRKPTDKTIEERGAFKTDFDKFSKESRDFFNYQLLAKSHRKFFMRKDEVVQDAEYALAKTSSILKGKKQNEIIDKGQQEQKKIDSQIEELQKKLKTKK